MFAHNTDKIAARLIILYLSQRQDERQLPEERYSGGYHFEQLEGLVSFLF